MFDKDPLTALEAFNAAQWLAFAPLAFQAASVMRERGILRVLDQAPQGSSIDDVARASGLSAYASRVLLEAGLGLRMVVRRQGRYFLAKLGRVLLHDELTRVNFDFTRDVCYRAAAHLDASLMQGRPEGLQELGPWTTLYEGLANLPEPARRSWHAFDHYYSELAFPRCCALLDQDPPTRMLDIGCNTGLWAQRCLARHPDLQMGLVDMPTQLALAAQRLARDGLRDRAILHPLDLLDPAARLPEGYDLIWMSQFLDCFSDEQIVQILRKVRSALPAGGRVWILELFWDRQRFEAAALSLQQTSLYFTCVANGNSQMYDSTVFLDLVDRAGLVIESQIDGIGGFHTLLQCGGGG